MRPAWPSLARTADELAGWPLEQGDALAATGEANFSVEIERTGWGDAQLLRPALQVVGTPKLWGCGASAPRVGAGGLGRLMWRQRVVWRARAPRSMAAACRRSMFNS